jgi:hypothetical protein
MSVDNFIPEVWAARLLENLHNATVYGSDGVINRDYEGEISDAGSTVRINSIGTVTVSDYVKNTDMAAPQVLSDAQAIMVIDQAKSFNFQIDNVDTAQARPNFMNAAMAEAAYALRNTQDVFIRDTMLADAFAANTVGASGDTNGVLLDTTGTAGTNAYERIVDMSVFLDNNNVPEDNRWVVVPPWIEGLLLKDARFVSFGTPQNLMRIQNGTLDGGNQTGVPGTSGQIGRVAGFNVYKSNNVKTSSSNATASWAVIAGHGIATTFADQINKVVAYSPEKRFADAVKGLHLYGSRVVRPYALSIMYAKRA